MLRLNLLGQQANLICRRPGICLTNKSGSVPPVRRSPPAPPFPDSSTARRGFANLHHSSDKTHRSFIRLTGQELGHRDQQELN
ncbi:hypothetical protein GWI33_015756 [Rhynchophorus ferrugineus]|uniref:Uncharacterized protein n=1 Tax=Rhynchophorus ferrugineus TaxID=354439 RepID=A0A834I2W6_RHYFE|nr:hypothetical protein GWI33_015756 [Rhynchophorus ferrugineus]